MPVRLSILALLCGALPAAHALCTSDGAAAPAAVLERFIDADCAACWADRATPEAPRGTLALDWVLPGAKGDDAPLSAVALPEAADRLRALRRDQLADKPQAVTTRRTGAPISLRLAQGVAFNDYVGASIELKAAGREPWNAWLLLVEQLPAGTEGSPVARNLVRNVFRPAWSKPGQRPGERLAETRSMQIHPGALPERLRLVAVVQDGTGRMRAIRQTECSE